MALEQEVYQILRKHRLGLKKREELIVDLLEFINKREKAITVTRCCNKLNDEILQPFKDFVNANYWEQDNEYICKETNKKEDLDDIIRYWHQEY